MEVRAKVQVVAVPEKWCPARTGVYFWGCCCQVAWGHPEAPWLSVQHFPLHSLFSRLAQVCSVLSLSSCLPSASLLVAVDKMRVTVARILTWPLLTKLTAHLWAIHGC